MEPKGYNNNMEADIKEPVSIPYMDLARDRLVDEALKHDPHYILWLILPRPKSFRHA